MNRSLDISERLLSNGFAVRINTRGSSMFPLIRTGDKAIIGPDKDPEIGDIIVYKINDTMIGHRLVKIFERDGTRHYQTRGDSLFSLDEPVTAHQILGKVIKIERENVSLVKRILLLIYPALGYDRLNAFIVLTLTRIRSSLFARPKEIKN